MQKTTRLVISHGGFALLPAFAWNVALDGTFVISRPLKDAGTWRTGRLRAASLVPLRLEFMTIESSQSVLSIVERERVCVNKCAIQGDLQTKPVNQAPREKQPALYEHFTPKIKILQHGR